MGLKIFIKKIIFCVCCFYSYTLLAQELTTTQQECVVLFKEGIKLADKKEYENSISFFDKAIEKCPKFISAYKTKSSVLVTLGKFKEALQVCDDFLKKHKEQPTLLSQKSFILYKLQNYKESVEVADRAIKYIKYGKDNSTPYRARANAHGALGHYKLAIEDYDKALNLAQNPNYPFYAETYLNRFCPLYQLKRYDEALATCNKALEITNDASKLPQIYSKKALLLNTLGKHKEALENAEKALKINSQDSLGISEKKIAQSKLQKGWL